MAFVSWEGAVCAETDPELFFPEKGGSSIVARSLCKECPIRVKCLQFALSEGMTFGIWGGTTVRDRRELRLVLGFRDASA